MSRNQSNEILIFGLNAAFQSTLYIKEFRPGHVNRASRKCNSIGGKGQNFAIACAQYGELDKVTVVQAVGGMTGKYCEAYLDEVGIHHITSNYVCNAVKVGKTTRTCTTILDLLSGDMTELIEPAGRVEQHERLALESTIKELIANSPRIEGIALCGTLPPGLSGSIYTFICTKKPKNCVILLDAFQNIECLTTGLVDILKINAEEARSLSNMADDDDLIDCAKVILNNYSVKILAITDGASGACLFDRVDTKTCVYTVYRLPKLTKALLDMEPHSPGRSVSNSLPEATGESFQPRMQSSTNLKSLLNMQDEKLILNPLGAGDTCSAIFLLEYLDTRVRKFGSDDFEDPLEIEWDAMEADLGSCYGMNPLENNGTPRSNAGGVGHHLPRDTRDSTATASRMNESAEKSRIKVVCIKGQPEPNRVLRNSTIGQSTATQTLASPTPTHTFVVECERPEYLTRVPFEVVGGQVIPRDPSVSTVICDAICYRICMTILGCAGCAIMGGLGLIGRELFTPESDDYN